MSTTLLHTIGNTPLVELPRYSPTPQVHIYAKLEGVNPGGSIKDRIAATMIADAQQRGLFMPHTTLIEATSGNTGIALAMISAIYGYHFIAVMPESASEERKRLIRAFGADMIFTDGKKGTNYAIEVTKHLVAAHPHKYIMLDQFANPMNVYAHFHGTGEEILRQLPMVTHVVAGMGTGGTLMGIAQRMRTEHAHVQIIGVEPLQGSTVQGLRNMQAYIPPIFDRTTLTKTLNLPHDDIAFELAQDLMKKEGISVGISSGAALWGAMETAKTLTEGNIVVIFPDRAERYMSTKLMS